MLARMRLSISAAALALILLLSGCATTTEEPAAAETAATVDVDGIRTVDDGLAWVRSLDADTSATELSSGITRISELVPDLDIWFQTSNEIGQALVALNADVLGDPENAGTKVDDLKVVADQIEAAIAKGNEP